MVDSSATALKIVNLWRREKYSRNLIGAIIRHKDGVRIWTQTASKLTEHMKVGSEF